MMMMKIVQTSLLKRSQMTTDRSQGNQKMNSMLAKLIAHLDGAINILNVCDGV